MYYKIYTRTASDSETREYTTYIQIGMSFRTQISKSECTYCTLCTYISIFKPKKRKVKNNKQNKIWRIDISQKFLVFADSY